MAILRGCGGISPYKEAAQKYVEKKKEKKNEHRVELNSKRGPGREKASSKLIMLNKQQ
eukprot:m.41663 g.41663  ORF g.41663 m.41663 type:complete len:58 (+) comp7012_c0_seq1:993-1166(+)